jgi:hypothetical protein
LELLRNITMTEFTEWDSFYLIVGGAAGALIGLQFVVMTLIADRPQQSKADAGHAFATPTTMHFGAAFLLSAVIRVPWKSIEPMSFIWALMGTAGVLYSIVIVKRIRDQRSYRPVFEDWLFHAILPFVSYAALVAAGFTVTANTREALFLAGGSALLLLIIGIHNAWDTTTYNVFVNIPNVGSADKAEVPSTLDGSDGSDDQTQ